MLTIYVTSKTVHYHSNQGWILRYEFNANILTFLEWGDHLVEPTNLPLYRLGPHLHREHCQ